MTTIQELVRALRAREGVDAAVLLGRDGLVIDAKSVSGLDAERLAALVPLVVNAAEDLGRQADRSELVTAVLEYGNGVAIVSPLGSDAILLVFTSLRDVAPLLYEVRRNRARLASLV